MNSSEKKWTLPDISRAIIGCSIVAQLTLMLVEQQPWQGLPVSLLSWLLMLLVTLIPSLVLGGCSYAVKGRSIKSWTVLGLSVLLIATTIYTYVTTFFVIAEVPKNAQAGVAIILLPIYQLVGGSILGGIGWAIGTYYERQQPLADEEG